MSRKERIQTTYQLLANDTLDRSQSYEFKDAGDIWRVYEVVVDNVGEKNDWVDYLNDRIEKSETQKADYIVLKDDEIEDYQSQINDINSL